MNEATVRFDKVMASEDTTEAQNVPDMFLEPIRLSFEEPDYSRLDKPSRPPPRPAAAAILSPVMNGAISSGTMSPETRDPTAFFSNDDAFAATANATPVRNTKLLDNRKILHVIAEVIYNLKVNFI